MWDLIQRSLPMTHVHGHYHLRIVAMSLLQYNNTDCIYSYATGTSSKVCLIWLIAHGTCLWLPTLNNYMAICTLYNDYRSFHLMEGGNLSVYVISLHMKTVWTFNHDYYAYRIINFKLFGDNAPFVLLTNSYICSCCKH